MRFETPMSPETIASVERYLDRVQGMDPDSVLYRRIEDIRAELRGEHGPTGRECIAAELVACTLGQRSRPELRADISGRLAHMFARLNQSLTQISLRRT